MKQLMTYQVSRDLFDKILTDLQAYIEKVDDIHEYFFGYKYCPNPKKPKWHIVYGERNNVRQMIILERVYAQYDKSIISTEWKQVRLECANNENVPQNSKNKDINPIYCWNYVMKIIKKHYNEEEINSCFNAHIAQYNDELRQVHYNYKARVTRLIYELKDCYYYDINGAHCDALTEIFPKCREDFNKLYLRRKTKGNEWIKSLFNYFVGNLCNKGHRDTYNWIVQRTTKLLFEAINKCKGELIYANTDGFIVKCPQNLINYSKELGDFKLEYQGTVYVYSDINYILYQMGDDMKGTCRNVVRDRIDLREGKVVHYSIKRIPVYLKSGKVTYTEEVTNIIEENYYNGKKN